MGNDINKLVFICKLGFLEVNKLVLQSKIEGHQNQEIGIGLFEIKKIGLEGQAWVLQNQEIGIER